MTLIAKGAGNIPIEVPDRVYPVLSTAGLQSSRWLKPHTRSFVATPGLLMALSWHISNLRAQNRHG